MENVIAIRPNVGIGFNSITLKMIEVFKTNVRTKKQAEVLLNLLSKTYPDAKINFDLSDRDKIVRLEGECILPKKSFYF